MCFHKFYTFYCWVDTFFEATQWLRTAAIIFGYITLESYSRYLRFYMLQRKPLQFLKIFELSRNCELNVKQLKAELKHSVASEESAPGNLNVSLFAGNFGI